MKLLSLIVQSSAESSVNEQPDTPGHDQIMTSMQEEISSCDGNTINYIK